MRNKLAAEGVININPFFLKRIEIKNYLSLGKEVSIHLNDNVNVYIKGTVIIESFTTLAPYQAISIGHNTSIQKFCHVLGEVYLGSDVLLAPNVFISSGTHHFNLNPKLPIKIQDMLASAQNIETLNRPVFIDDDVWIGVNSVILPGVRIGKGSVVAASSIVKESVYPYTVVGGAPGKKLKDRYPFKPLDTFDSSNQEHYPYLYAGGVWTSDGLKEIGSEFSLALQDISDHKSLKVVLEDIYGETILDQSILASELRVGIKIKGIFIISRFVFDFTIIDFSSEMKFRKVSAKYGA